MHNTCCQCVGGSSGAVDSTSASFWFVLFFLLLTSIEGLLDGAVGKTDSYGMIGDAAGQPNSTLNQNAKPWNGDRITFKPLLQQSEK
jgi:hypothetical protein